MFARKFTKDYCRVIKKNRLGIFSGIPTSIPPEVPTLIFPVIPRLLKEFLLKPTKNFVFNLLITFPGIPHYIRPEIPREVPPEISLGISYPEYSCGSINHFSSKFLHLFFKVQLRFQINDYYNIS